MEDVEIATKIVSMEKDIEHIKEKIEMLDERMVGFIDSADKKYAAKYSEYIVKSMVAIILGTVLVALLARVIIK